MRNPALHLVGLAASPGGGGVFGNRAEEELQQWLETRLDALGIDPVAYSRFVLSLLRRPDSALSPPEEVLAAGKRTQANGRRYKHRPKFSLDRNYLIFKQKRTVVQCLLSAAEVKYGVETLVDELCTKLKNLDSENSNESKEESDKSDSESKTNLETLTPYDKARRYYAAFPALQPTNLKKFPQKKEKNLNNNNNNVNNNLNHINNKKNNGYNNHKSSKIRNKKSKITTMTEEFPWQNVYYLLRNHNADNDWICNCPPELVIKFKDLWTIWDPFLSKRKNGRLVIWGKPDNRSSETTIVRRIPEARCNIPVEIVKPEEPEELRALEEPEKLMALKEPEELKEKPKRGKKRICKQLFPADDDDDDVLAIPLDIDEFEMEESVEQFIGTSAKVPIGHPPSASNERFVAESVEESAATIEQEVGEASAGISTEQNENNQHSDELPEFLSGVRGSWRTKSFDEILTLPFDSLFEENSIPSPRPLPRGTFGKSRSLLDLQNLSEESDDDLLTSERTHFKPIKYELVDGYSFPVNGRYEAVNYRRSESGTHLYVPGRETPFMEFKNAIPSRTSHDFTLKFPVHQCDKSIQTEPESYYPARIYIDDEAKALLESQMNGHYQSQDFNMVQPPEQSLVEGIKMICYNLLPDFNVGQQPMPNLYPTSMQNSTI